MKRFLKINLILFLTIMFLTGCRKAEIESNARWDQIEKNNEIVIGIDDTFVPMGFRDNENKIVGFDIDLAKKVTKELGIKPRFQPIDWTMKETELENGTIDAIWNGYSVTQEREKKVDFTKSYLKNEQIVVSLKESNISTLKLMNGKTLGAQEGSSGADLFEGEPNILKNHVKNKEAILYPTFTEAFLDLEAKRIDGLLIDKVFAEYYISIQPNSDIYTSLRSPYETENFAVGVRKGETKLLDQLNKGLKKSFEAGDSKLMSEKWFGNNQVIIE